MSNVGGGGVHPFVWDPTDGLIDIGLLSAAASSGNAQGINDAGTVVDASLTDTGVYHAFIWTSEDGLVDLNNRLLGNTEWQYLENACDISNNGWITGYGTLANGDTHAFLLTPVPVPARVLLGILGLGTAGWRLKRRGME